MVGPFPIGWDTIAFYVPNTLDWAAGKAGPLQILATAPLIYAISVPVYELSHVNPIWIFKIMGPILYGSMIFALYRFLRSSLGWKETYALGAALLTSLYFVTLRISWDMYRNMLGLTFILLGLPLLGDLDGLRNRALLTVVLLLAVASDQLTGALTLAILSARVLRSAWTKKLHETSRLCWIGLPSGILFAFIVYAGQLGGQQLATNKTAFDFADSGSTLFFLSYAFLPLLPLAFLGIKKLHHYDLRAWSTFCTLAIFLALMPLYGLNVPGYRWTLLLDIPVCVYATMGILRLARKVSFASSSASIILTRSKLAFPILLLIGAGLYLAVPAQQALPEYAIFPGLMPTSMVQSSVPWSDMGSLRTALGWVSSRMGHNDVLITHQAIYGWARAYLPPTDKIINYGYASPLAGLSQARSQGYSTLWTIWWKSGLGWHGQPALPAGFSVVVEQGNLAVYTHQ